MGPDCYEPECQSAAIEACGTCRRPICTDHRLDLGGGFLCRACAIALLVEMAEDLQALLVEVVGLRRQVAERRRVRRYPVTFDLSDRPQPRPRSRQTEPLPPMEE